MRKRRLTRLQRLQEVCADVGLSVDTWSPGDGITRYRFFPSAGEQVDYFAGTKQCPYGLFTALGWHEATVYLIGKGVYIE